MTERGKEEGRVTERGMRGREGDRERNEGKGG